MIEPLENRQSNKAINMSGQFPTTWEPTVDTFTFRKGAKKTLVKAASLTDQDGVQWMGTPKFIKNYATGIPVYPNILVGEVNGHDTIVYTNFTKDTVKKIYNKLGGKFTLSK